jgi:hypothetical protein
MKNKFIAYCIGVSLLCSVASWSSLDGRARGGAGGNSWHSGSSGSGHGGWAGGGGHK